MKTVKKPASTFMVVFLRILAFAVGVTGLASLLNYAFDLKLSLEGTEAPTELGGSVILLCLALTLFMWSEYFAKMPVVTRFVKAWYSEVVYFIVSVSVTLLPAYLFYQADKNYSELYAAMVDNRTHEFENLNRIKKLSQQELGRLFSESIRRNNVVVASMVGVHLKDPNGKPESPNAMLAAYLSNPEIFKILISKKADFSVKEKFMGQHVVHSIIGGKGAPKDKTSVLNMLVKNRLINLNAEDNFKTTALLNASERAEYLVVEFLLQNGALIRHKDQVGNEALIKACSASPVYPAVSETDRIKTVRILLNYGAEIIVRDYLSRNCYELAREARYSNIAHIFRKLKK